MKTITKRWNPKSVKHQILANTLTSFSYNKDRHKSTNEIKKEFGQSTNKLPRMPDSNTITTTEKKIQVVDLFCGCGGFTKGLEDAGLEILAGIDN